MDASIETRIQDMARRLDAIEKRAEKISEENQELKTKLSILEDLVKPKRKQPTPTGAGY